MIEFNTPPVVGTELAYISKAIESCKLSGDGAYAKLCQEWFQNSLGASKTLMTPSCTAALEMSAILLDVKEGDEIIMPSYTFVSTANAFVLRGAKIVFVDIRPDTLNIDENKIEAAITERTKAIVPVHYAGVGCEMDSIMALARRYKISVVEDAAQAVLSTYKGKPLGSFGDMGAFSFHETKNYTSGGEGGLISLRDEALIERAEIIREKGTDRSKFFRGMVDKYGWVDVGSSFLPSELQCAYLYAQLENAEAINNKRLTLWHAYHDAFVELEAEGLLERPTVPEHIQHNAHMYYVKTKNDEQRSQLIQHLAENDVRAVFHYVPLHSSQAGRSFGRFNGNDDFTTKESGRLLRLPLFYQLTPGAQSKVISAVKAFYQQ